MTHSCVICETSIEDITQKYEISVVEAEKVFEMHHVSYRPVEKKVRLCANCHTLVTLSETFRNKHQKTMEDNVSETIHWKPQMICLDCGKKLETVHEENVNGNKKLHCPFCDSNQISFTSIKVEKK